jgi:hypothetical protein
MYKNGGWNYSLHGRIIITDDGAATVCFTSDGQIDYDKTTIHMGGCDLDVGWEVVRQFIENLGYEAKIEEDGDGPHIQVRGGAQVDAKTGRRGCTVVVRDGQVVVFFIGMKDKNPNETFPESEITIETSQVGLYAPDSLGILAKKLKNLLDRELKAPWDA